MEGLLILTTMVGLVTAVLWLLIGWRAMIAHERIADSASRLLEEYKKANVKSSREEIERNLYHQFLAEANLDKTVSLEKRTELFKNWKANLTNQRLD